MNGNIFFLFSSLRNVFLGNQHQTYYYSPKLTSRKFCGHVSTSCFATSIERIEDRTYYFPE